MNHLIRWAALAAFSLTVQAETQDGIQPRGSATDYPAHAEVDGLAIGAALLTAEQVRHNFVSDLNRGYLVVEVSTYPNIGVAIELARHHFVLKTADGTTFSRPADPKTVAAILLCTGRQVPIEM